VCPPRPCARPRLRLAEVAETSREPLPLLHDSCTVGGTGSPPPWPRVRWACRRATSSPASRGGARRCHAGGAAGRIALEGTLVAVGRELCFIAAARRTLGCRPWMGARRRCGLPLPAVLGRSRVASAPSMVVGCGRARAVTSSMVGGTELTGHGTDPSSPLLHCFLMLQLLYIGVAIIFLACCNCSSSR
jgi:hypothetical protein